MERFLAICKPFFAQKHCTLRKTQKTIIWLWVFAIIYCSPWFGLTEVKPDEYDPNEVQCEMRLSRNTYILVFGLDLLLFYVVPLTAAVVIYTKIGRILYRSVQKFNPDVCQSAPVCSIVYNTAEKDDEEMKLATPEDLGSRHQLISVRQRERRQLIFTVRSRLQVL